MPSIQSVTFFLVLAIFLTTACQGQNKNMSQDVESTLPEYYGIPQYIAAIDTSAGWLQPGQKLLITGYVYHQDGHSPAANVIIYYYHTNKEGKYVHDQQVPRSLPPNKKGQTHGYLRGWVKTNEDGKYSIYTTRPGTYPTRDEPAHIHVTITEPGSDKPYLIDDWVFDDDPLLTGVIRKKKENRGGTGVLRLLQNGKIQVAEHNIILGLNIPGYQKKISDSLQSGLQIGEDQPSFGPFHAFGPDKGSRACPVCKYGRYHGIIYFVGNNPDWNAIKKWLIFLEQQSIERKKYLKAYFVYGNESDYSKQKRIKELEKLGMELNLRSIALTYVPSWNDTESETNLNKINAAAENTFIIYRNSTIVGKFVNLQPTDDNFQ